MKEIFSKYSKMIGKSYKVKEGKKKSKLSCQNELKSELDLAFGNIFTNGLSVDWFYKENNLTFAGMKKYVLFILFTQHL